MFVKNISNGDLAEVVQLGELINPNSTSVTVRYQAGEEAGDPASVDKSGLVFPSGESLPKCWLDAHYRISF
jgi:hypothetical protein